MLTKLRTLTSILLGMCFVLVSYPLVAESSPAVDEMVVHRDIDYIDQVDYADNKDKLDIFMPVGAKDVPVLVFFHGGALQVGDKSEQGFVATRFIPEGVGVVLANYRLSPLVMHPAHIRDAATAFAWVVKNIEKYGGDPKRIYLSGQSAGAYLALLLSLDPSYLQAHGLGFSNIRATLASSPFTFVEEVAKVRPKTVWGTDPKIWMEASVTPYIGKGKTIVCQGVGVVLANYRLSPLVMHPAHIRDAATAFAWVVKNIEKYGGDPKRIYLSGQSAGAYLALLLSLDPSYLQAHGLGFSNIRATLASSPFTFVEEVAKVRPKTVWGTDPKIWMEASVTPYIGKGKPPILMVYADGDEDWRKQNIEGLKEKLLKAGHTKLKAVEVPNRIHSTVWTDINEPDDQTAKHFLEYMRKYE